MSEFNPNDHMRILTRSQKRKGKNGQEEWITVESDYLDVKWRLVWLRQQHPEALITTDLIERTDTFALFRASVSIPDGGHATGHGSETKADFGDFIEKAETKAIGRALAALGYGTQFCGADLDEGQRIVDSPVERTTTATGGTPRPPTTITQQGSAPVATVAKEGPTSEIGDPELERARAALTAAMKAHNWTPKMLLDAAGTTWPHVLTKDDLATMTAFQVGRLTDVVTGESVIDSGGRIVPSAEPPIIASELANAMK